MKSEWKRVCVVCEGQTEETFVRDVLAPALYNLNLNLIPELIETSPGHKGGALQYERVKKHLRGTLQQKSAPVVTTLFDLYRLDKNFSGFNDSNKQTLPSRLSTLKDALHKDVVAASNCRPDRFIPHIQPYEFEALLFSDVTTLMSIQSKSWGEDEKLKHELEKVCEDAGSPEHINDQPNNKPSTHLGKLSNPSYRKRLHGPRAAKKIGLAKIEEKCKFFAGWLEQIRALK